MVNQADGNDHPGDLEAASNQPESSNRARGFRPDGVGGRPTLDTGEPVLARWFAIFLLIAVPLGMVVTVWATLHVSRDPLSAAARRPPGTTQMTHDRGRAVLADAQRTEQGPACAVGVTLLGDEGGIATGRRALTALCGVVDDADPAVRRGLLAWQQSGGILRIAVFELSGVDATTRVEDGAIVIELNAKFQFDDAAEAMPMLAHELVHLADGWPLLSVTAQQEQAAMVVQDQLCRDLVSRGDPPRGCIDARELREIGDVMAALREAGYPG